MNHYESYNIFTYAQEMVISAGKRHKATKNKNWSFNDAISNIFVLQNYITISKLTNIQKMSNRDFVHYLATV